MRILGVALLTIFLIAIARFVFIQPDVQSLVGLRESGRVTHDLVSTLPLEACEGTEAATSHTFIVRESDTWTALAGSPGFNSVSFNMPKEVPVVSGVLILDVSSELQTEAVARMRVNVNGERRGEIILGEGVTRREIRVNLLPSDLTQSQLEVSLGAFGAFPQQSCRREFNGGMIVRIEPTSRVELETEAPLVDLNDRLRATGNPYQIQWPEQNTGSDFEKLMAFAVDQRLRDIRTEFVPEAENRCPTAVAFAPEDIRTAEIITRNARREFRSGTWPVYFALEEEGLREARFFEYESAWRYAYDLRSTPRAEYPTELGVSLDVVGLQADAQWLLSVTLNGSSILAEKFGGEALQIRRRVALPLALQDFSNVIEIKLISSEIQDESRCNAGSPITAQLNAGSALYGGVPAPDATIGDFINALTGEIQLDISEDLNAAEASSAVAFLAETFGDRTQWDATNAPDSDSAIVFVTTRREVEERMVDITTRWTDHDFWLVWPTLPEVGELPYNQRRVEGFSLSDFVLDEGPRIAAIVAVPRLRPREMSPAAVAPIPTVPAPATDALPVPDPEPTPPTAPEPAQPTDDFEGAPAAGAGVEPAAPDLTSPPGG